MSVPVDVAGAAGGTPPDFSCRAYLLPPINQEGMRFGAIALLATCVVAVLSHWMPPLCWLVLPLGIGRASCRERG